MDRAKVFLIGGPPGAGKSTLAHEVARHLNIKSISIDDLSRAARGVTTPESHPGLHVLKTGDHVKYFTHSSPERVIADASEEHDATWPAIEPVIRTHSKSGDPSPDPERMLSNFLERSYWCNDLIEDQARSAGLPILHQDGSRPVNALCKLMLRLDREQRGAGTPKLVQPMKGSP